MSNSEGFSEQYVEKLLIESDQCMMDALRYAISTSDTLHMLISDQYISVSTHTLKGM